MLDFEEEFKSFELFDGLNSDEIEAVIKIASLQKYKKGEILFQEDSTEEVIYIITEGKLEISAQSESGKRVTFSAVEKGMVFGEMSFLDGLPRSATVKTLEDVEVFAIRKEDFEYLIETKPKIAAFVLKNLGKIMSLRLRNADSFIIDVLKTWEHYYRKWEDKDNDEGEILPE